MRVESRSAVQPRKRQGPDILQLVEVRQGNVRGVQAQILSRPQSPHVVSAKATGGDADMEQRSQFSGRHEEGQRLDAGDTEARGIARRAAAAPRWTRAVAGGCVRPGKAISCDQEVQLALGGGRRTVA